MRPAMAPLRGVTIVELLVALGILGLVLSFAAVSFAQVFKHYSMTDSKLDMQRTARLATARVTYEFRQTMPDLTDFPAGPPAPVAEPTYPSNGGPPPPPTSEVQFFRVAPGAGDISGTPSLIPVSALGAPNPAYEFVDIAYDSVNHKLSECVEPAAQYTTPCTNMVTFASNIGNFQVQPLSSSEYLISITAAVAGGAPPTPAPFSVSSAVYVQYYP